MNYSENNSIENQVPKGDLMKGKVGLVMGIANKKSIAWGIANALHHQQAKQIFSYQGEILKKRIEPLAQEVDSVMIIECDVTNPESIIKLKESLKGVKLDFFVHAVAYSDKNELDGDYLNVSYDNFVKTLQISCYSFTEMVRALRDNFNPNASILTLSYYGAEKYIPHYNVMGVAKAALESSVMYMAVDLGKENIRVNCISAGPIKTLAASGISDMRYMLRWNQLNSPLKRNVTIEEVGKSAVYLLSDLASGVTGQLLYVDCGYHVMGMKAYDAPDVNYAEEKAREQGGGAE